MKNLNANQHGIVFDILRLTDLLYWRKFYIPVAFVIAWGCWPLKCQEVGFSNKGFTDMMAVLCTIGLIHDGQSNSSSEGPFQDGIIITLHHVNEQRHVFAHSTVNTIQVDPHTQLVPIQVGVEGRAVYCCHDSIYRILPALSIILYPPYVRSIADTSLILQQFGFIAVKSDKWQNRITLYTTNLL